MRTALRQVGTQLRNPRMTGDRRSVRTRRALRDALAAEIEATGDLTQVDLPRGVTSGLRDAVEKLHHLPSIGFIHFDKVDIVRHPLVAQIVDVYDQRDKDEAPQQDN